VDSRHYILGDFAKDKGYRSKGLANEGERRKKPDLTVPGGERFPDNQADTV
jgi:hypothetical protein